MIEPRALVLTLFLLLLSHEAMSTTLRIVVHPATTDSVKEEGPDSEGVIHTLGLSRIEEVVRAGVRRMRSLTAIDIALEPGRHQITAPVVITRESLGGVDTAIRFHPRSEGRVLLSGLVRVDSFVLADGVLGLPSQVYQGKLPGGAFSAEAPSALAFAGATKYGYPMLVFNGRAVPYSVLPLNRYGTLGYTCGERSSCFSITGVDLSRLRPSQSLLVHAFWDSDWADSVSPMSIRADGGKLVGLVGSDASQFGFREGQRAQVMNVLEGLEASPGWAFDPETMVGYLNVGRQIRDSDVVEVSVTDELLQFRGVSNLSIEGLDFEGARKIGVKIVGGANNTVRDSTFRSFGEVAVWIESRLSGIEKSSIASVGTGGIVLRGGGRDNLVSGGVFARSNKICGVGWFVNTRYPAIFLEGVGGEVEGNWISDVAYIGVLAKGNDHIIASNVLTRIGLAAGDVGALYVGGRDWTARGSVVRGNYIFDVHAPGRLGERGIYLDDQVSGVRVEGNVVRGVRNGIFVGGGSDNLIRGNLIFDSDPPFHIDNRGETWQHKIAMDPSERFQSSLAANLREGRPYAERYPELASLEKDRPWVPKRNVIDRNFFLNDGRPSVFSPDLLAKIERENRFAVCSGRVECLLEFERVAKIIGLSAVLTKYDEYSASPWVGDECRVFSPLGGGR